MAFCPSSSSSSWSTSSPSKLSVSSFSATTNIDPIQDSVPRKSLKRKRSPSSSAPLSSEYPMSSRPPSIEVVIKDEGQGQEQEGGLCERQQLVREQELGQNQKQESHTEHESSESVLPCLDLPKDVYTTHLHRSSSALVPDIVSSTLNPEPQPLIPTSFHYRDQGTQTHLELPLTETYLNWSGRGRSPFKTPAIAAIENLKKGAKLVEWLERQVIKERIELEKVIQLRFTSVNAIRRVRYEIVQNRMDPLESMVVLPKPAVDEYAGKSSSPERFIAKMRFSTPPIKDETLEGYQGTFPEQVRNLILRLGQGLGEGCIPLMYEAEIKEAEPLGLLEPANAFSAMESRSETSIAMLWDKAQEIRDEGLLCKQGNADKNAWGTHVVQKVLEWETGGPGRAPTRRAFSDAENIASQLPAKSCRQTYNRETFETRKTDWALAFSPLHPDVALQYNPLNADRKGPRLSQMNNDATSKHILYSAVVVKVPGGNIVEAQAQLFTWFQAGVSCLRQILMKVGNGRPDPEPTHPLLGWTVIGGDWQFYVAFGDGNKEGDPVIILGPIQSMHCYMLTYFGTFKLLQLLERVKDWAREVCWPWYRERVIEPLKLVKDRPRTAEEAAAEAGDRGRGRCSITYLDSGAVPGGHSGIQCDHDITAFLACIRHGERVA